MPFNPIVFLIFQSTGWPGMAVFPSLSLRKLNETTLGPCVLFYRSLCAHFLSLVFFICFSLVIVFPEISSASGPFITDIDVHPQRGDFFFSAKLKEGITKEIKQLIESGAPVPFRYFVTLKMKKKGWRDKTVGKITIIKALKFDRLKKVYKTSEITKRRGKVKPGGNPKGVHSSENRSIGDFEEAVSWISHIDNVFLVKPEKLKPSQEYYIQVRADLRTTNLWVPLNYILFFLSFWDVDTGWAYSSAFNINLTTAQ